MEEAIQTEYISIVASDHQDTQQLGSQHVQLTIFSQDKPLTIIKSQAAETILKNESPPTSPEDIHMDLWHSRLHCVHDV